MNFTNLENFMIICEELSITRAAERLYMSQQSLSSQMSRLEEELGVILFNRKPCLSLTYAGERLLCSAKRIVEQRRQLQSEMDDIANHMRGQLRIGISHTRGRVFLPRFLPQYMREHPYIDISLIEGNTRLLEEAMLHDRIDVLVGFAPIKLDDVETAELLRERLFLVVPDAIMRDLYKSEDEYADKVAKFSRGAEIFPFAASPFLLPTTGNRIRTIFDNYAVHCGVQPNVLLVTENLETLLSLAYEGLGITVYPEMFYQTLNFYIRNDENSPIHFFPLSDESTIGTLIIGYHTKRYISNAVRDYIDAAKRAYCTPRPSAFGSN